ncbi:hypothetical protein [Dyadobacter psychrotolerans]|uniref:Uncharacterized protein n=1 Tax=Dyadobacter psychrotolerans TaxID=2541721 RepID=A0A4R5DND0_9BACT|nr:hypothetical protein [Dyadobacter psychrotolerans]TDE12405.1 hypothetical protein E0F88_22165 [Dyadobacter psychrotolerans]
MKKIFTILLTSAILTSSVGVAKLSNFSKTSETIDFDKLSKEFKLTETLSWTMKTSNEYYFEKENNVEEATLIEIIKNGLRSYNYSIAV